MDEEPYRCLSVRSGLDRSTFDAHARRGLRLRTSRALVHMLVGDERDQEHQGDIAKRVKDALTTAGHVADLSRAPCS
jgi:hypothetical protein